MSPALSADNNNKSAKREIPFSLTVIVNIVKLHMKSVHTLLLLLSKEFLQYHSRFAQLISIKREDDYAKTKEQGHPLLY